MKNQRLLLAGGVLVLAHVLASIAPPPFRLGMPLFDQSPQSGNAEKTSGDICQTAGPAVVTIYAGKEFGAGSVVGSDGLVITNHHVVKDAKNQQVWVKMLAGNRYRGKVTAADPMNDLALVQLSTQEILPTVPLYNAATVEVGQEVCAIGSPFNRPGVLTRGTLTTILSNGDLQSALKLFPGNSGGPLLNLRGEMIGINKAIWKSRTGENSGISYATNVTVAKAFIEQNRAKSNEVTAPPPLNFTPPSLLPSAPNSNSLNPNLPNPGSLNSGSRMPDDSPRSATGWRLGVMVDKQTLEIQIVEPNSPAQLAGLQTGDRLVAINGIQLSSISQLQEFLSRRPSFADLIIDRNYQEASVRVSF